VTAPTVAQAFEHLCFLERAAQTLMLAYATGQPINVLTEEIAGHHLVGDAGECGDFRRNRGVGLAQLTQAPPKLLIIGQAAELISAESSHSTYVATKI
jgi:hypothetical protein